MKVLTVILGVCAYSALSILAATAISEEKSGNDTPSYIVALTGPDEGIWLQLFYFGVSVITRQLAGDFRYTVLTIGTVRK